MANRPAEAGADAPKARFVRCVDPHGTELFIDPAEVAGIELVDPHRKDRKPHEVDKVPADDKLCLVRMKRPGDNYTLGPGRHAELRKALGISE